jgi:hypothetical protein
MSADQLKVLSSMSMQADATSHTSLLASRVESGEGRVAARMDWLTFWLKTNQLHWGSGASARGINPFYDPLFAKRHKDKLFLSWTRAMWLHEARQHEAKAIEARLAAAAIQEEMDRLEELEQEENGTTT